jgi:Zn-dependent protease with chaperone function
LAVFFERARGFVEAQITEKSSTQSKGKDNKEGASKPTADKSSSANTRDGKKPKPSWDFKFPDWLSTHPSDAARIEKLKRGQ